MKRFRQVVEREGFAAVIEVRYRATPYTDPTYLDEAPQPRGGVKNDIEWHVVYLRTPSGQENNPVDMIAAEATLRLEEGFEEYVRAEAENDFAQREARPGKSRI